MTFKLYKADYSPPARAAMMGCEIFNVPAEMIDVDLLKGAHKTPEYLKKNPMHRIPVLEDEDFIIHDSHAILQYLADGYGKNDSWYPKDLKKRILVDQKLFFDTEILFPRLKNITYSAVIEGERTVPQKKIEDIKEAYDFVEQFLTKTKFLALNTMSIADISAFATVTSLACLVPVDSVKYPKIQEWIKNIEKQPFAKKCNEAGLKSLDEIIKLYVDL